MSRTRDRYWILVSGELSNTYAEEAAAIEAAELRSKHQPTIAIEVWDHESKATIRRFDPPPPEV